MKCHIQCTTCSGYGATFCTSCRHYKQEDECVSKCRDDYFVNPENNECLQCDQQCLHCHGPTAADCTRCKLYKVYSHSKVGEITAMVSDGESFLHCWFCRFCNWMCWIFILNVFDPTAWNISLKIDNQYLQSSLQNYGSWHWYYTVVEEEGYFQLKNHKSQTI